MTKDVQDAIQILRDRICKLPTSSEYETFGDYTAAKILHHAIRHLAYPDRDIYPKTRKGTKGAPIVRR